MGASSSSSSSSSSSPSPLASVSEDILCELFLRVSRPSISSLSLVSRRWHSVLSSSSFWQRKCEYDGVLLPSTLSASDRRLLSPNDWRRWCNKRPIQRNLVVNPCGEQQMEGWTVIKNGGDRWVVEQPPVNTNDVDQHFAVCFATSYANCIKQQIINLHKEGIPTALLDAVKPAITVSEWHSSRVDCAAEYTFRAVLLDAQQKPLVDFTRTVNTDQWTGGKWAKMEHSFTDYPPGVRHVMICSGGKDRQFWAGHYGPKMTAASITVAFQ